MVNKWLQTRPVLATDFDWLLALRLATMGEHLEASGHALSLEEQSDRLRQDYSAIRVIQDAGSDVGMIKVVRESAAWQLVQVQIAPEHQRKGLGTMVIKTLLDESREARIPVSLHVLKVNPARRLYERLGFKVVEDLGHSYEMQSDA